MRLVILVFAGIILCSFGYAQQQDRASVSLTNAPLTALMESIEKQTSYRFYYMQSWVDSVQVTVNMQNSPVPDILQQALQNSGINFFIDSNRIILTAGIGISPEINRSSQSSTAALKRFSRQQADETVQSANGEVKDVLKVIGARGAKAKDNYSISGYVRDRKSGEPLPGAIVRIKDTNDAALTDAFGFYSLRIEPGRNTLLIEFTGMKNISQSVDVLNDGKFDITMEESISQLKEVVVESDRDANISNVQMGVAKVDVRTMKNIPRVFGENDVLKVATSLPGVKSIGEGASGLNVRGGHADQNLVLLNEATIYNTSHFLGFFSVFNPDALRSFELYKSGMPVQHGGRLSSIFELSMRDGNKKKFSGQGGIGPITSHLTFEVPLVKDKTSLMFGGRTTYSNWVLRMVDESSLKNTRASFYDYFARITHSPNDKNTLYLSLYASHDKFNLSSDTLFAYSNQLASLQWRHVFNPNVDAVFTVTHSRYDYNMEHDSNAERAFRMGFGIAESNLKAEVNHAIGKHKFTYGLQSKLYQLDPGSINKLGDSSLIEPRRVDHEMGVESAAFVSHDIDINDKLSLYYGVRYSLYASLGPRKIYEYATGETKSEESVIDSAFYNKNQIIKTYHGPEWRLSLRYKLSEETAIKASYNRTRQYIQMLSNTVSISPLDTWKLSDANIAPQLADQVSLGFYKDLKNDMYETSVEVYYKWLQNTLDFKTAATLLVNEHIEQQTLQGRGKAYGAEFFLRKKSGIVTGWLSYTYSRTFIRLNSPYPTEIVNRGEYFPANYDKPHDVSVVSNYKITRRYSFSLNFSYSTGRPITYPIGAYRFGSGYRIQYSDRNAYRIPDYLRMDIGFNIEGNHKIKKLAHSFWSISIYNVMGRRNPYSVFFRIEDGQIKAYSLSIFGVPIPTITYHFKF